MTNINLDHNHLVSREAYEAQHTTLTGEEVELVKDLGTAHLKPRQIQNVLMSKADKRISCKKLQNFITKICPTENEHDSRQAFTDFLEEVDKEGGKIEQKDDPD